MKVIIFGCGRTGSTLALLLQTAGHSVTVIDQNADEFRRLGGSNAHTIVGNGLDEDVLLRAGIDHADAFVAATRGDNRNLMAAQMVRDRWNVGRVCAKISDPIRADTFRHLGVFTITPNTITAGMMRDYLLDEELQNVTEYNRLFDELLN